MAAVAEPDFGAPVRARVLRGVGQRFLRRPVQSEPDLRRQRPPIAGHGERGLDAGRLRRLPDQAIQQGRPGQLVAAQRRDRPPGVGQPVPGGSLGAGHLLEHLGHDLRVGPPLPPEQLHAVQRQHQAGQRVREDVVDLAGQPGPLGQGRGLGLGRLGGTELGQEILGPGLGGTRPVLRDPGGPGEGADREDEPRADVQAGQAGQRGMSGEQEGNVRRAEDGEPGDQRGKRGHQHPQARQRQVDDGGPFAGPLAQQRGAGQADGGQHREILGLARRADGDQPGGSAVDDEQHDRGKGDLRWRAAGQAETDANRDGHGQGNAYRRRDPPQRGQGRRPPVPGRRRPARDGAGTRAARAPARGHDPVLPITGVPSPAVHARLCRGSG